MIKQIVDTIVKKWIPIIVFILCVGEVLISTGFPGLQLDAVNPDYYAVQLLNPVNSNPNWLLPSLGYPFFAQIYHGTITLFFSCIQILITGTTSLLQLRVLNALYGAACCIFFWMILQKAKCNSYFAAFVTILVAISPNLRSFYRTQYYIMLPGVALTLASIFLLQCWWESNKIKHVLFSGLFAGLAFYDYFSFLFCLPGFLVVLSYLSKEKKQPLRKTLVIFMLGYILGILPYLIGAMEIILVSITGISYPIKVAIVIGYVVIYICAVVLLFYIHRKDKLSAKENVISAVIMICGISSALAIAFFLYPLISGYLIGLNVGGKPVNLVERIKLLIQFTDSVVNHSAYEYLFMPALSNSFNAFTITTIILLAASIFLALWKRSRSNIQLILMLLCGLLLYYVFCLPLASRMQSQHFVVVLFILYLLLALCMNYLFQCAAIETQKPFLKKTYSAFQACLLCILFVFSLCYSARVNIEIQEEKNVNNPYYSETTEICAKVALERKYQSENEFYVFPEWGIMTGFNYLTLNNVPFTTWFDADQIRSYFEKEYAIVLCYFELGNRDLYVQQLQEIINDKVVFNEAVIKGWGSDMFVLSVKHVSEEE